MHFGLIRYKAAFLSDHTGSNPQRPETYRTKIMSLGLDPPATATFWRNESSPKATLRVLDLPEGYTYGSRLIKFLFDTP